MELPSRKQCEQLFVTYKVPSNIKIHCYKVNQVAMFLGKKLQEKRIKLNVDLIDRLSLLHDIFKAFKIPLIKDPHFKADPTEEEKKFWTEMKEKYNYCNHETQVFYEVFKDKYLELAEAMRIEGEMSKDTDKQKYPLEYQIVHYADWRVFVDEIIPLVDRIDDLFKRYKHEHTSESDSLSDSFRMKIKQSELELERSLFKQLDFSPDKLKILVG